MAENYEVDVFNSRDRYSLSVCDKIPSQPTLIWFLNLTFNLHCSRIRQLPVALRFGCYTHRNDVSELRVCGPPLFQQLHGDESGAVVPFVVVL